MSFGRYKPYSKYHDSGAKWLGGIPIHWAAKRLGQFFDERRDKVSDKHFAALSVTMQGIVPQLETAAKTDDGDNRKLVRANDFVINSRSDRKGSAGVSPLDGSVSLISTVLTPRNIEPRYVHHLLRSYPFQEEFYRFGKGIVADLWSTNYSEMKNILIPALPLTEQTQIAAFLDHETSKIDRLIEKQQALISLLKEKRHAVVCHAVTKGLNPDATLKDSGVECLGQVPTHWGISRVRHALRIDDGPRFPINRSERAKIPGEFPYWGPTGILDRIDHFRYDGERALIGEDGDHFTKYADWSMAQWATGRFNVNNHAHVIDSGAACCARWFYFSFLHRDIGADVVAQGVSRLKLTREGLAQLWLVIPPLDERQAIIEYLEQMISRITRIMFRAEDQITLLQERRTALISAAVTGKIDVRHWRPFQASAA